MATKLQKTQTLDSVSIRSELERAANLERHVRKCAICHHPERESIEDHFIRWDHPLDIAEEYKLPSRSSLYRHAEATGLLARRRRNLRGVAERILENVDNAKVSGLAVLRALRLFAHTTEDGQLVEPPKHTIVTHIHTFAPSASLSAEPAPNLTDPLSGKENQSLESSVRFPGREILIGTPNSSQEAPSD